MKRFARALVVALGIAGLASVVALVPQKSATAVGGAPVTIMSPLPLPVSGSVNATVGGTVAAQQSGNWNVGIDGTPTVNANVSLPNPLPVQPVQQSAANFVSLDFEGGGYFQVLGDGRDDLTPFKLNSKQLVITDVQWEISCASGCVAGDAVTLALGDNAFRAVATYANRGGLPVAGGSDHLASGFVADALPNPTVLSGTGSATIDFLVLRGYVVP